jgi:hypothetical protein
MDRPVKCSNLSPSNPRPPFVHELGLVAPAVRGPTTETRFPRLPSVLRFSPSPLER